MPDRFQKSQKDFLISQMDGLNSGQREAVLHREGPMLVTAGPGSGKTHVITTRLIHLISECCIPPEKIAVITFTKETAVSMCSRFQKNYQKQVPIFFGTFHSFYYRIIKSVPIYSQFRLIQENEKKYLLQQIIKGFFSGQDEEVFFEQFLSGVSYYKNTLNMQKAAQMISINEAEFQNFFQKYEAEKIKKQVLDFDDMLFLCRKLLTEHQDLLAFWQEKFTYYLVDEFQDCNPVQYEVLKMLSMENVFVVGDDDQAIYGFRGAQPKILQQFLEDYPKAKQIVLGINYRCAPEIVKASEMVICENKLRMDKKLCSYKTDIFKGRVSLYSWQDRREMCESIGIRFGNLPKEELYQHAVFFRTNQEMQMFAAELIKRNIPFELKEKQMSIYDHFVAKDIMTFFQAAYGCRERKLFLRILNKPRTHIGREALEEEIVDFEKMKCFYRNEFMRNGEAVRDIERLEHNLKQLKSMPLALGIRYIRKGMGYEEYLVKRARNNPLLLEIWTQLLDWLQEEAADHQSLQAWQEAQKEYKRGMENKKTGSLGNTGIHLLTLHGAKGLEFEHCYILNVNEGKIPQYHKGQILSQEQLEEERRIFYVGMTRAKKTLELHYQTGTKERPKFSSRFIRKFLEK